MSGEISRAYVLVTIQPGKEQEFANEIMSKGLIFDSKVDRLDFVHGAVDFIILLSGKTRDIDLVIMEIRKLPYVRKTDTLIPFEMVRWDDVSSTEGPPSTNSTT